MIDIDIFILKAYPAFQPLNHMTKSWNDRKKKYYF